MNRIQAEKTTLEEKIAQTEWVYGKIMLFFDKNKARTDRWFTTSWFMLNACHLDGTIMSPKEAIEQGYGQDVVDMVTLLLGGVYV